MTSGLLIVGFHRSGTSAVAQLLQGAGLDLGANLLGAEPSNPYGHFEDLDIIAAHDAALASHGLTWKDPVLCPRPAGNLAAEVARFTEARMRSTPPGHIWGVKDPRICLFLDEWIQAKPDIHVLVVIRQPGAAVSSLHRRHARRYVDTRQVDPTDLAFWQDPDLGLKLWIHYHEQLLASLPELTRPAHSHAAPIHLVDFDDRAAVERIPRTLADLWGLPLQRDADNDLDPELGNRSAESIEVRDPFLIHTAEALWDKLTRLP